MEAIDYLQSVGLTDEQIGQYLNLNLEEIGQVDLQE